MEVEEQEKLADNPGLVPTPVPFLLVVMSHVPFFQRGDAGGCWSDPAIDRVRYTSRAMHAIHKDPGLLLFLLQAQALDRNTHRRPPSG
jgi:hypothetical protein